MLEKPKLFLNLKQFWFSMLFLFFLLTLRLSFFYIEYQNFIEKPFYFTQVEVLKSYQKTKSEKKYTILKLYSSELHLNFFTTTFYSTKEIHQQLRMKLFPSKEMKFSEYLGTSFIHSQVNEIFQPVESFYSNAVDFIDNQHENKMISDFYNAIFFAHPLEKELRQQVSVLGVSHLIALSGFHLAILSGLLFFLLRPIYRFFQQRYFPYRFDLIDVGFLVLVILAGYVWFVDSPDSLIRSYMMLLIGWFLLLLGIELLTLSFLTTITLILLIIFPYLLFSLAFWFSIIGVFYIFLLLHYFSYLPKIMMTLIISFGLFFLMLPVVHMVFPLTTPLQLLSPFLSLFFSAFYPLSMLLHLLGIGGVFDTSLLQLFTMNSSLKSVLLPSLFTGSYLLLSLGAFYFRTLFYLLLLSSLTFSMYLFIGFWL
jgi:competence protein ComEC